MDCDNTQIPILSFLKCFKKQNSEVEYFRIMNRILKKDKKCRMLNCPRPVVRSEKMVGLGEFCEYHLSMPKVYPLVFSETVQCNPSVFVNVKNKNSSSYEQNRIGNYCNKADRIGRTI